MKFRARPPPSDRVGAVGHANYAAKEAARQACKPVVARLAHNDPRRRGFSSLVRRRPSVHEAWLYWPCFFLYSATIALAVAHMRSNVQRFYTTCCSETSRTSSSASGRSLVLLIRDGPMFEIEAEQTGRVQGVLHAPDL